MTDLQKEFEATGYTSWINSELYPEGRIYTQEYTQWLEGQVLALRQPLILVCDVCGSHDVIEAPHMGRNCNCCNPMW